VAFYVKTSINETFGFGTTLSISNINPNNCHVQFWKGFDNSRFGYENNIVEDISRL